MFNVPLWASLLVTTTLTVPATCAAVVAVIDVLLVTFTPVAAVPPRLTLAPARKPAPVRVTEVPPFVVPVLGVIEASVGAGLLEEFGKRTIAATEGTPLVSTRKSMWGPGGARFPVVGACTFSTPLPWSNASGMKR